MIADLIEGSLFREVTAILVVAAVVALVGMKLRQPLIVSFIAVGLLVGPSALGLAGTAEADPHLHLFAELGIALLLFLVGLKLDLGLVRTLGPVALMTGLGQVGFTSVFGFLICLALGMDWVTSLYIAVALTFSSTIIIVKLLSDKREVDSLHGRIALGFLIVQDIVVVIAMVVLSAIAAGQAAGTATSGTGGAAGRGLRPHGDEGQGRPGPDLRRCLGPGISGRPAAWPGALGGAGGAPACGRHAKR